MKYSKYNAVIIGSGLAGLYLAIKLSQSTNIQDGILLVTKNELFSGSTSLAQGGIVSVIPEINPLDSVESHIKDTIQAGCGLNNLNVVKFVSENSCFAAQELIAMGVEFDRNEKNMLNFTLEGAHCAPRILHARGDSTGSEIEKILSDKALNCDNLDIYTNTIAVELLVGSNNNAHGVVVYNSITKSFEAVYSNNIIIATGGIGQLYKTTTNPITQTGDGIALAINAGAKVDNMEYVQFHPTGLYCKNKVVTPLISESVRGEGAKLVNINGEYFAKKYHKDKDLAPRDIVARAIFTEMKSTNCDYVNLDISQIGIEKFKLRFPTITKLCIENNIDINSGLIPVAPVQHYFMGGIKTNLSSMTNIKNLYAIGECSMSGLHGANRLASNSLLECAVFAQSLSEYIIKNSVTPPTMHDEKINNIILKYSDMTVSSEGDDIIVNLFEKLKLTMSTNVGIVRSETGLNVALDEVKNIKVELKKIVDTFSKNKFELECALTVSEQIIKAAINNKKSIGAHYRKDSNNSTDFTNAQLTRNNQYDKLLAR